VVYVGRVKGEGRWGKGRRGSINLTGFEGGLVRALHCGDVILQAAEADQVGQRVQVRLGREVEPRADVSCRGLDALVPHPLLQGARKAEIWCACVSKYAAGQ